jgi:nucleoside-diphosphate-sugar epimerase
MNILITGATGFVGRFLCSSLLEEVFSVRGTLLVSENPSSVVNGVEPVAIEPLGPDTPWRHALIGIDTVIHLAARVHVMDDSAADPLTEFRKVNVEGTAQLAREAAKAGVKRLVFISSIKVNGEENVSPYTLDSPPNPSDPYGISKWEAEQALRQIETETGLEVVIIRPTLVYGPGVKANFLNMMKIISRGIPLPLASVANKRSLIYVGNLVDALVTCASHPAAVGQTYLVSDGENVSTPELIRRTASALGVSARLLPFPTSLMRLAGRLTGKTATVHRLMGSLTVDCSKIRRELGWVPPFTMEEGLLETAAWFMSTKDTKSTKKPSLCFKDVQDK